MKHWRKLPNLIVKVPIIQWFYNSLCIRMQSDIVCICIKCIVLVNETIYRLNFKCDEIYFSIIQSNFLKCETKQVEMQHIISVQLRTINCRTRSKKIIGFFIFARMSFNRCRYTYVATGIVYIIWLITRCRLTYGTKSSFYIQ